MMSRAKADTAFQTICKSGSAGDLEVMVYTASSTDRNLRIDEELARAASRDGRRVLRLWWGGSPTIVLGCADKPEVAVDVEACRRLDVEIVRRVTGGGTVLQTGDVFNYSYTCPDPGDLNIRRSFEQGARLVVSALSRFGLSARYLGTSDVAVGDRKISGNAQARKWHAILLHGTLLVDMDWHLMESVLRHPDREPDYREGRSHREFMTTLRGLGVDASRLEIENAFRAAAMETFAEK